MFEAPFSFDGRIRRTEFGISFIIYFVVSMTLYILRVNDPAIISSTVYFSIILPVFYFMLAQGAKRCHDIGKNGWWQLIPFFNLYLCFAEGEVGDNQYGLNPKGWYYEDDERFKDEFPGSSET